MKLESAPLATNLPSKQALWYQRKLQVPEAWRHSDLRVLLHIGACDSAATVYVNGKRFQEHIGGSTAFYHDITDALNEAGGKGADILQLKCTDRPIDGVMQPCGKQFKKSVYAGDGPHVPTLYSNVTGIWQTVWLEAVPALAHLERVQVQPCWTSSGDWSLDLFPELPKSARCSGLTFEATLFARVPRQHEIASGRIQLGRSSKLTLKVPQKAVRPWCPEDPHLYGLCLRICKGSSVIDEVKSYTALRTVERRGDQFFLNGQPRYLRLVLDQGYYHDGIWTAPSLNALRKDVKLAQELGFNGARLHQKVFEPLYFKCADELGFLVFAEYPDWNGGASTRWTTTDEYRSVATREWETIVADLQNHPSIIAWTLFNEFGPKNGWKYHVGAGGPFRTRYTQSRRTAIIKKHCDFVRKVMRKVRQRDAQRRPVQDASGWVHVTTDLWSLHDYTQGPAAFADLLADLPKKLVDGRRGQPLLVGEYAGVGIDLGGPYGKKNPAKYLPGYPGRGSIGLPKSRSEALERISGLTAKIFSASHVAGFCFTQLYDVEYEKNGLLRYDRTPKFSKAKLRRIFHGANQCGRWAMTKLQKRKTVRKIIAKK